MTSTSRPSVRAVGARRLSQATLGMVLVGLAGVGAVVAYDAAQQPDGTTSTSDSTSTSSDTGGTDQTTTNNSTTNGFGGGVLSPSQSMPDATSGGS